MSRSIKLLLLAMLALAVNTSSGAAASRARPAMLGAVPHAGPTHAFQTLAPPIGSGPLVLQSQPCTLTGSPEPCWTMRTNTTYAIYWIPGGFSVSPNYESLIDRYLSDVAAASNSSTNVYSVATQYYDSTASIHYQSTFGGSYVDTAPYPPNGCDDLQDSVCLTDQQLQTEIQNVLTARGWHGGTDAMFFILTPDGVGSCFDGSDQECTTNAYCAYHSGFEDTSSQPVLYANEPYDAGIPGCASGSSPNGDDADATINTMSHEQNETITDPWGNAWLSNDTNQDEEADLCSWDFGSALGGAGNSRYNQVIDGDHYWVQREYSNEGDACLQQYTPSAVPASFASPVVSGAAGVGQQLTSNEGAWQHAPSTWAYQWQRCAADGTGCASIAGAAASSYQLAAADVGDTIRVSVTAGNVVGSSAPATSAPSSVVVPVPAATGAPALSGVAAVGKQLTTTAGTWNSSATFAYQWLRCTAAGTGCSGVPGATAATYVAVAADSGHRLEAQVSATNAAGAAQAISRLSGAVIAVPRANRAPHVSGSARVGRMLAAVRGSWSGPPKSYRYQWLRCNARGAKCVRIKHATHSRYRLTLLDARHRLRVRITAVNAAGSRTASSPATARVPATR
jgi:hypothetical protein